MCSQKSFLRNIITLSIITIAFTYLFSVNAQEITKRETLCILDFHRLGNDARMDWLKRGLSDMMITTMNRLSPYTLLNREDLNEILKEHNLISTGFIDEETAIQQARLAKAQYLLLGNFTIQKEVIIQARLIRVLDQEILSMATWEGSASRVLRAPYILSKKLLTELNKPFDPNLLKGIEQYIPRTVDVAESFYKGMEAYDNGDYPQSLAFYLDGAREAENFFRIYTETIKMYYLLGQNKHAVVFAHQIAQKLEKEHLQQALRFYFLAGEKGSASLNNNLLAITYWEKIVKLTEQYEEQTHEAEQLKQFVKEKILTIYKTEKYDKVSYTLSHPDLKYKIWSYGIDVQGKEMDKLGRYTKVLRNGQYVKEPIPEPSVFMWKTRAQLHLAREHMKEGNGRRALAYYDDILRDYDFINQLPIYQMDETHFWGRDIDLESLFMLMFHLKKTGELIRDERRMVVLEIDNHRSVFTRDYKNLDPDPRTRVWSRRNDGGHEYFDFAAPEGYYIKSVMFQLNVKGISELAVYLPDAKGWPPRYDFSKFVDRFTFLKGKHKKRLDFPVGTEFFSVSVLWGPRWAKKPLDIVRWKLTKARGRDDLAFFKADFVLSPKQTVSLQSPKSDYMEADKKVIKYFVKQYGWDEGVVLRDETSNFYSANPTRDVYSLDWIAYAQDGEIHILEQNHPEVKVKLPIVINTNEYEYDPSLVRTHEGRFALFFSRGGESKDQHLGFFYSTTKDLIQWETPKRLKFDDPEGHQQPHQGFNSSKRTFNIVPIPNQYMMLLEKGFVRYSDNLRQWGLPKKLFKYECWDAVVLKTKEERIWIVATDFLDEEVKEGDPPDPHFGYYTTGDGKKYRKSEAIVVTTSVDGINWSPQVRVFVDRETSGLWAFPVGRSQIVIAVSYNNLYLKWAVSRTPAGFSVINSPVQLLLETKKIHFFVKDKTIYCLRPVHDFVEEEGVALIMGSQKVYKRLMK